MVERGEAIITCIIGSRDRAVDQAEEADKFDETGLMIAGR